MKEMKENSNNTEQYQEQKQSQLQYHHLEITLI